MQTGCGAFITATNMRKKRRKCVVKRTHGIWWLIFRNRNPLVRRIALGHFKSTLCLSKHLEGLRVPAPWAPQSARACTRNPSNPFLIHNVDVLVSHLVAFVKFPLLKSWLLHCYYPTTRHRSDQNSLTHFAKNPWRLTSGRAGRLYVLYLYGSPFYPEWH